MMPQTRISEDVWQLGKQIAAAKGLKNERQAIEAVVRVYAKAYLQSSQAIEPTAMPAQPITNAKDALSSLMNAL